jgi:MFS family permease
MSAATPFKPRLLWNSRTLSLAAVLCATVGVGLTFGFQPPLMAFVLARQGASSFAIGAITSASTIAVILLGPFYPAIMARSSLRYAIIGGTGIAVAILLIMPLRTSIETWLVLRFINGCALGLAWIASEVWLNTLSTDQTRGTVMSLYTTVFAAGVAAGPLLLQLTGTSGGTPFYVGALCLGLTALPLFLPGHEPSRSERSPAGKQRLLATLRIAPLAMFAALIAGLVESADVALLPVLGLKRGLDEHASLHVVMTFLAGNVLLQLPIGRLADRFGRARILAACATVSVIGPLLLISPLMRIPWLLWPLLLLWGGTMYGFYSQGIALLGDSYPTEQLASANAAFVIVYCAGGIVGPSLGGMAMDLWTPNGLVVFLSSVPLLLIIPWVLRLPTGREAPPPRARALRRPADSQRL